MNWTQLLVIILPTILLFGIGYLVRFRKSYWMISGYNTMSAEKKKNVDVENLGVLVGNTLFYMGGILLAGNLLLLIHQTVVGIAVMSLIVPTIIYLIISAQKYDGNTRQASGQMKTVSRILIGVIITGILIVVGLVGFMLYKSSQPASITLDHNTLIISGLYGQSIPVADIQKIDLLENLPVIQRRTNGSAVGDQLSGHFQLQDIGQAVLYLNRSQSPFIYLESASQKIYFNLATPDQTRQLFEAIRLSRLQTHGVYSCSNRIPGFILRLPQSSFMEAASECMRFFEAAGRRLMRQIRLHDDSKQCHIRGRYLREKAAQA